MIYTKRKEEKKYESSTYTYLIHTYENKSHKVGYFNPYFALNINTMKSNTL